MNITGGPSYKTPEPWDGSIKEDGFWDDSRICPGCRFKIIFFNSGKKKDHYCTICRRTVKL